MGIPVFYTEFFIRILFKRIAKLRKNYVEIMHRLAFGIPVIKKGFCVMCCERGPAIVNVVSLSPRRLLFEFCP